jgi:hypothetical protein
MSGRFLCWAPLPFEAARTHLDLATLAQAQEDQEVATRRLTEAHALFRALQVPKYVKRAAQLTSEVGISLPENTVQDKT